MRAPAVSVIMPIRNVAPWVEGAVRSIVDQSLTDWEMIVVDDGSDDGSGGLVEAIRDPRIRSLRQPRHGGICAALNRAAREARGGYLARMDGDDVSHPHRLLRQLEFMRRHPEVDLAGTDYLVIDREDRPVARMRFPADHRRLQRMLPIGPCLKHGTWMFRKEVFEKLRGYRFDTAEDYDFLTRADTAGLRFGNLPEVLYSYRQYEGNVISTRGAGLRQIKTLIYIQRLYRRRRRGLPESHEDRRLARCQKTTRLMERLHHLASRIASTSAAVFARHRGLRYAGYAVASVLSPYVGYQFFLSVRRRIGDKGTRAERVVA